MRKADPCVMSGNTLQGCCWTNEPILLRAQPSNGGATGYRGKTSCLPSVENRSVPNAAVQSHCWCSRLSKKSSPRGHHHPPSLMWFAWLCRHTYFATSFVISGPEWEKHHIRIRPRVLRCGLRVSCARCEERQLAKEKLRQRRSRNEHKEKDQDLLTTLPVKSPALLAGLQVLRKTPRPGEGHEYRKLRSGFVLDRVLLLVSSALFPRSTAEEGTGWVWHSTPISIEHCRTLCLSQALAQGRLEISMDSD